jgi:adhesin/invasin
LLVNGSGEPVAGEVVRFSATAGQIAPTDTSDDQGVATAIFTAPSDPDTVIVSARYGSSQLQTVELSVQADSPPQGGSVALRIDLVDDQLLANGFAETVVRAKLADASGKSLKGQPVSFSSTAGTITSTVLTDSAGTAAATLVAPASGSDVSATVTAEAVGVRASASVLFLGVQFSVSANPLSLIADGRSKSEIRALLKETTSKLAIEGAEVTFATDLGTIPRSATTSPSGVARAELTSDTQTGTATVVARYGDFIADSVKINMWESVPNYLTLSADPTVLIADNRSTSTITASVSDAANNPVPDGTIVTFEITAGSGTIEPQKGTQQGVATSILTSSTQPDTVVITARVGELSETVTVRYVVGSPAAVSVVADSTELPADGITSTRVRAFVLDEVGNPVVDGTLVNFETNLGDINPSAQTVDGVAEVQLSSSLTGLATVRAQAGEVVGATTVRFLPGPPNSILLTYDPSSIGVKDSGRNQTLTVTADVRDAKNNAVADGTYVTFSLFSSPGGGESLSSTDPVPTLNGRAQVSLNSGTKSGTVRIMARVTDAQGQPLTPEVRSISTEIIIFAGPPYIEDVNDASTSHLTVGTRPLNILGWNVVNNTARVLAVVGDKFNNPVPAGTAVYFTTSGGVVSTHTGFTDEQGVAEVVLHTAQPYPTITRFYNTFFDPNAGHPDFNLPSSVIPGPIPDFEGSRVLNSLGTFGENDGIARIMASTEGVDSLGNSARVWSVSWVVFSGGIDVFTVTTSDTVLSPGESATITIRIYDVNGNPIVGGSTLNAESTAGALSWATLITDDPGRTLYTVALTNNIDPADPDARETTTRVSISVKSENGNAVRSSEPIRLLTQ